MLRQFHEIDDIIFFTGKYSTIPQRESFHQNLIDMPFLQDLARYLHQI